MYDRWVENNAKKVAELEPAASWLHPHRGAMDEDGLERFLRSLYSDNFDKEAIVLDVRLQRAAGTTHDQVLSYLTGHGHTLFRERDGREGTVVEAQDRKWNKPLVLPHQQPLVQRRRGVPERVPDAGPGKLVGQPTGGYVIGTGEVRLSTARPWRIPGGSASTTAGRGSTWTRRGVQPGRAGVPAPRPACEGRGRPAGEGGGGLAGERRRVEEDAPGRRWRSARTRRSRRRPPAPPGPASAPPMFMPGAKVRRGKRSWAMPAHPGTPCRWPAIGCVWC